MSKQRRYSAEFKLDAASRMEHCETITGLARELGIRRKFSYQWRGSVTGRRQSGVAAVLTVALAVSTTKATPSSALLGERLPGCYTLI